MQEALENITAAVKSGRTDIVKRIVDVCHEANGKRLFNYFNNNNLLTNKSPNNLVWEIYMLKSKVIY